MKKIAWYRVSGSTRYPNFLSQLVIAFIAGLLLVFDEAQKPTPYFIASMANMVICLAIIRLVFWITQCLDYHYPWSRSYRLRLPRQLFFGTFMPLLLMLALSTAYYAYAEINILQPLSFKRYLQQLIWMLLTLNGFLFYYWAQANQQKSVPRAILESSYPNTAKIYTYEDIACIFIEQKNYFAYRFNGEKIIWPHTLTHTLGLLDTYQFFLVNRSCIINRQAIVTVKVLTSKKTKLQLSLAKLPEIEVSQRENAAFKKWLANTAV